ncbi:MAG: MarR family transcriptional regulator [Solirubrobacterales bacterium]|nr:MarR family transcriptional regulator [Solirubrobacterales bacterium]
MAHGLAERGLTRARAELIWRLHEREPLTQRELADALGVTPRNVTALLDALQAGGFVDRAPHPTDRRATFVTLSERGRTVAAGLHADQRAFATLLFEGVAAPELARFDAALERIVARLHELTPATAEEPC